MMRKTILSASVAVALLAPALALAQTAPAPAPSPLTGNVGLFSQYIFRGLQQTGGKPALQGGVDYAHSSGFYLGTWMSNISWLSDFGGYTQSSLEWDFYGGYKGSFAGDFGYDVGLLQYYYPGRRLGGTVNANTTEAYGALSWKWISAKFSYSITDRTFGVQDSFGTYYLDLTANFPVTDKLNLVAHYGIQKFTGNGGLACPAAANNDTCASYDDYKFGATFALPDSWTIGAMYTGTSMSTQQKTFYRTPNSFQIGKDTVTAYLQKTF
jgi:uncharacterized protein (TIGR02001 family)